MKCRGTNHWFSAEWKNSSLQLWIDETNVFDTANFQAGVDTLYNKCVSCGSTPSSKTPTAISNAIQSIYTNRYNAGVSATKKGNATASQVLDGRTFTNSSSVGIEGTMPNRGNLNWSSSNTTKTVSAGYYSGGTLDSRPSYNAGRTQGQNDVKNNPNGYGLYNKTQYDNHYKEGYNAGKKDGGFSSATDISSKITGYASQNHGFRSSENLSTYKYIVVCATYQKNKTANFSNFSGCSCLKQITWIANGDSTDAVSTHLVILHNITGAINVWASSVGTGNHEVGAFGFK